jgi:hypothetical protein
MEAGEAAFRKPCFEPVDMPPLQPADVGDRLAGSTEIREELGQRRRISPHGRSCAERTAWSRKVTKRPCGGEGEAPRPERGELDQRLAAILHRDRKAQARDRIDIGRHRDAVVAAERDPATLARAAAHGAAFGTSNRSSSTAASTVSARAAMWSR